MLLPAGKNTLFPSGQGPPCHSGLGLHATEPSRSQGSAAQREKEGWEEVEGERRLNLCFSQGPQRNTGSLHGF